MRIAILFTCYNRIEKTRGCIQTIEDAIAYANAHGIDIEEEWYIADAGSDDGTNDMLSDVIDVSKLHMRVENDVYYSQGMRIAMEMCKEDNQKREFDYVFMINDDVSFDKKFLYKMISKYQEKANDGEVEDTSENTIYVGATCSEANKQSYGGARYDKPVSKKNGLVPRSIHYSMVKINDDNLTCHTFNANCVMIPYNIFMACDIMDKAYVHGLGDFDYGMSLYREENNIVSTDFYVGVCDNNSKTGTWLDKSLGRKARVRALNSVKGAPTKKWFYYLNKHFGFATAVVHSVSPYVRILLKK